jgi:hypothetical protein
VIAAEVEQVVDLIVGREEALRLTGRFELFHLPLSSACRLAPPTDCGRHPAIKARIGFHRRTPRKLCGSSNRYQPLCRARTWYTWRALQPQKMRPEPRPRSGASVSGDARAAGSTTVLAVARNRMFESSLLQRRDAMGRAARTWQLRRFTSIDGVPRCPSRTI